MKLSRLLFICITIFWTYSCSSLHGQRDLNTALTMEQKLIGTWLDPDEKKPAFIFNENKTAEMIHEGNSMGSFTWVLDDTKNPIHLDFVVEKKEQTKKLPMIIEFISDSKIKIRIGENLSVRPTGFSETDNKNQTFLIKK